MPRGRVGEALRGCDEWRDLSLSGRRAKERAILDKGLQIVKFGWHGSARDDVSYNKDHGSTSDAAYTDVCLCGPVEQIGEWMAIGR